MAGGHEATWAPVWAPRVRSREEIRRQLIGEAASLFKRVFPLLLIRVGLCPTRFVCFAGRVAVLGASDSGSTAVIAWT